MSVGGQRRDFARRAAGTTYAPRVGRVTGSGGGGSTRIVHGMMLPQPPQ